MGFINPLITGGHHPVKLPSWLETDAPDLPQLKKGSSSLRGANQREECLATGNERPTWPTWRAEDIALVVQSPISKKTQKYTKRTKSTGDDLIMKPGTRIAQDYTLWNSHRLRNAGLRNCSRQRTFCSRSITVRTLFARQFSSKSYNFVMSKMPPVVHGGKTDSRFSTDEKILQWLPLPSQ